MMMILKCYGGQACAEITQAGTGPDAHGKGDNSNIMVLGKYEFMWYMYLVCEYGTKNLRFLVSVR